MVLNSRRHLATLPPWAVRASPMPAIHAVGPRAYGVVQVAAAVHTSQSLPRQHGTGCSRRTVADVAAGADPNTDVAVYDQGAWKQFGGASAPAPIIASVYALAGNTSSINDGSYPYSH